MKKLRRNRKQPLRGFPVVLSATNKNGLENLIPLWKAGARFISTGGTLTALLKLGSSVTRIEQVTGAPPKFDGRIKTLHEIIFTMALARNGNKGDQEELKRRGLRKMGLIVMNPYLFEDVVAKPGVSIPEIIENIDIGGGAIPLASIKGQVPVMMNPEDYVRVVAELLANNEISEDTLDDLNTSAMGMIAEYYAVIAKWMKERREQKLPIYRDLDPE